MTYEDLQFFEEICPFIQYMWIAKENHKDWIKLLKNQKGWEKSRVTNFMKRSIGHGIVPPDFFDMPPGIFTSDFISRVIKKDKRIIKSFNGHKPLGYKQAKKKLTEICSIKFPKSFAEALKITPEDKIKSKGK
jgi:hypothetical protein